MMSPVFFILPSSGLLKVSVTFGSVLPSTYKGGIILLPINYLLPINHSYYDKHEPHLLWIISIQITSKYFNKKDWRMLETSLYPHKKCLLHPIIKAT